MENKYAFLKKLMIMEKLPSNIEDITVSYHGIDYTITGWYVIGYNDADGRYIEFDDEDDIDRLLHENKCSEGLSIADILNFPESKIGYSSIGGINTEEK